MIQRRKPLSKKRLQNLLTHLPRRVQITTVDGRTDVFEDAEAFTTSHGRGDVFILRSPRLLAIYRSERIRDIRSA